MSSENTRVRLRFAKGGALRFISHLDLLRAFQRAIRRAGLPAAYSQGFNPHILLSFALPLPLGMASARDYADIALTAPMPACEITARLNGAVESLDDGLLSFSGAEILGAEAPRAAAAVEAAGYGWRADVSRGALAEAVRAVMAKETLLAVKKTKSGEKEADIRPDIHALGVTPDGTARMTLSAGSSRFLNPELAARLILGHAPGGEAQFPYAFKRLELYGCDGGRLRPLMEDV